MPPPRLPTISSLWRQQQRAMRSRSASCAEMGIHPSDRLGGGNDECLHPVARMTRVTLSLPLFIQESRALHEHGVVLAAIDVTVIGTPSASSHTRTLWGERANQRPSRMLRWMDVQHLSTGQIISVYPFPGIPHTNTSHRETPTLHGATKLQSILERLLQLDGH